MEQQIRKVVSVLFEKREEGKGEKRGFGGQKERRGAVRQNHLRYRRGEKRKSEEDNKESLREKRLA